MKKDRNCGATPYPVYPTMVPGAMTYPNMVPNMIPNPNVMMGPIPSQNWGNMGVTNNTIEQQLALLQQQINTLEKRVNKLENMSSTTTTNVYGTQYADSNSNYHMM